MRQGRTREQPMRHTELDEPGFLARLRSGDEAAYRALIRRFHGSLLGVATSIIGSRAQAEEVVQDAWLAVFSGIGSFEGRSSLVTWIFSIVLNRAKTRASREGRLVGLPALMEGTDPGGRAVDAAECKPDGHWIESPRLWDELDPERIVGGRQLWDHVMEALDRLPGGQRAVIILRDMEGRGAEEACMLLGISPENQRVLLHRARGRIRQAIDAVTGSALPAAARTPEGQRGGKGVASPAGARTPLAPTEARATIVSGGVAASAAPGRRALIWPFEIWPFARSSVLRSTSGFGLRSRPGFVLWDAPGFTARQVGIFVVRIAWLTRAVVIS
jgi:RNA polymerase sigma-70 factor, ECF subfamily